MDHNEQIKITELLINWLDDYNYETYSLSIGHSSLAHDKAFAENFALKWESSVNWVRSDGGFIINIVEWPITAASWLKPAQRLNKDNPDAWILVGPFASSLKLMERLLNEKSWLPERTFCVFPTFENAENRFDLMRKLNGLEALLLSGEKWIIENGTWLTYGEDSKKRV